MKMNHCMAAGAVSGLLWIIIGAASGHHPLPADTAAWMEKAQRYHIVHALAILWLADRSRAVLWLWGAGAALFSGSLYLMALAGFAALRFIVPIGGILMLAGWAWLCILAIRKKI